MKKYILLLLFLSCATTREIPSPLKGSFENPLKISSKEAILECFERFKTKSQFNIEYIETVVGVDLHFVDKLSFPYKKWLTKNPSKKIDLLDDTPNHYNFYVDQYHPKNECEDKSIEELIEFPE